MEDVIRTKYTLDLTGQRFGKLTVVNKSEQKAKSGSMWNCKCDCGNTIIVARCSLTSGHTKSCGCTRSAFLHKNHIAETHGKSRINYGKCERLYRIWLGMRQRCNNPNCHNYNSYGGRGIYICSDWNNYINFRKWAYENGYDELAPRGKCTIDRINNDGPYAPDNCRFVDSHIQRVNQRRVKKRYG